MPSSPKFTATEWDTWIDQFPVSGLPQSTFCEREGLSRLLFARHYRRSDKFAGTRRAPRSTSKKKAKKASAFRPMQHKVTAMLDQSVGGEVILHIGQDIRLQCSASVGIEAIIRLAREARSQVRVGCLSVCWCIATLWVCAIMFSTLFALLIAAYDRERLSILQFRAIDVTNNCA